jgi:hypothetical protein
MCRAQEDDLEGTALYNTLGLEPKCSTADIKKVKGLPVSRCRHRRRLPSPVPVHSLRSRSLLQAYRLLAKQHHPDKGGEPAAFARLQAAFEVLIDPVRRQVYDTWAKELQFRCAHHRVQLNTKQHCSLPRVQAHLLAQSQ